MSAIGLQCPGRLIRGTSRPQRGCVSRMPPIASLSRHGHFQGGGRKPLAADSPSHADRCSGSTSSSVFGRHCGAGNRLVSRSRLVIRATLSRRGSSIIVHAALAELDEVKELLEKQVKGENDLVVGELDNGLRYVILPNKLPPTRFEAHLEVHAGSVDEGVHEQGVAHFVEHVTFLGSKKRESLLGTGARANAYTDFHHTVFHVHAPIVNNLTGNKMLPQVLDALEEIAFKPEFLNMRIEKERKAVLAEAQMMNTIEYRVDCQLLQYLHEENNLGYRFPIGKTEQVKKWPGDALKSFWSKWYFPANATLYIVGDLDRDIEATKELIQKTFGKIPAQTEPAEQRNSTGGHEHISSFLKRRHDVRPPVEHRFGYGPLAPGELPAEVKIFRHPLLHSYMLSIFCKLPIQSMSKMQHLRQSFMMRIILSVFQFRVHGRYMTGTPNFISIELDISDSGREGCSVSTLTITSEPKDWKEATSIGVQEIRRMQRHGLTNGELVRYREAILRDSSQLAEQANKIPSLDTLNFVMESLACGHTVMGHRDAHEAMSQVAETITLEEINALARSMLTFSSDYGSEGSVLEEARGAPSGSYAHLGPTRATSLVACIPAYVDATGTSVSAMGAGGRASLGASGHLDADEIDLAALEEESRALDEFEVPEGATKFELSPSEVAAQLSNQELDVSAPDDVETPAHLMTDEEVEALVAERKPMFVPLEGKGVLGPSMPPPDAYSGITQRRLSNGIRINYKYSDNEPKAAMIRVVVNGGRAAEKMTIGPDGFGAVVVGTRALSEVGTVGSWPREQTESFCVTNLINCALEADEENIIMDFHFAVGEVTDSTGNNNEKGSGLQLVFELLHMFLSHPRWESGAMERAKQTFLSSGKQVQKSLEKATSDRIMNAMMGVLERRFREPTAEEIEALTMEGMEKAVLELFHAGNMEISVVGDFNAEELERCLLRYVGTVAPRPPDLCAPLAHLQHNILSPPFEQRHTVWHLRDSDERGVAYISGAAPCRWGPFGYYGPLEKQVSGDSIIQAPPVFVPASASAEEKARITGLRRRHPLFQSVTLMLLTEIINSRLFTTVRDTLGLTYDVSWEVTMFDRVRVGWWSVHVTSDPEKIYDALNASVAVLRDMAVSPVNRREVARARTTLLTRHESDMKDNVYWLGLMTHLQNDQVPLKSVECLRDLKIMYEAATVEDIYQLYNNFNFDDNHIFTCIGISGKSAPPVPENYLNAANFSLEEDVDDSTQAWPPKEGKGLSGQLPNPVALLTAFVAAAQSMSIKNAISKANEGAKDSSS